MTLDGELGAVAERVDARLSSSAWDLAAAHPPASNASDPSDVSAAAEVAVFALTLSGKRRQARRGGRFGRLVTSFALAACVALASFASACSEPSANPAATATAISQLPADTAASVTIAAAPRAGPAIFSDLVLLDAGSDSQPWAVLAPRGGGDAPILVDRVGAGLDSVGGVYRLAAQPVAVGTRDGPSQFLDPLQAAESTDTDQQTADSARDLSQRWGQDERFLAATRAIAGQPSVLDAAYNAAAAVAAGGTHTYLNGVVLRVEPDKPVLQVIDRALLESGRPTRAEDVVYVAIRDSERALYDPGKVVNLRDVVMDHQDTTLDGQQTTVYVANAALDGARVEPTGSVDLQALLQPRLDRVGQDLAAQAQVADASATPAAASAAPAATGAVPAATPAPTTAPNQQTVVVERNRGPSFIDDFLIFMWLSNTGFYRGPSVIINNPSYGYPGGGGGGVYYSPPPAPSSGSSPSTIASSQAASRSTALQAARTSVSGQASGTGGGVAATNKSAADATARVSAATSKSASVASDVSAASAGKSVASVPSNASSTASRSAGSTSAGARGSAGASSGSRSGGTGLGSSSSSGSKGIGGSSSSGGSSGFGSGGKGIGGSSSSGGSSSA